LDRVRGVIQCAQLLARLGALSSKRPIVSQLSGDQLEQRPALDIRRLAFAVFPILKVWLAQAIQKAFGLNSHESEPR